MGKTKKILIFFILITLISLELSISMVMTKTYTEPPPVHELWSRELDGAVYSVAWSPDGDKILAGLSTGRIVVFFSNGSEALYNDELESLDKNVYATDVFSVAWSPDGSKIVVGLYNGRVAMLSSNGKILWTTNKLGNDVGIRGLVWTPDGEKIIAGVSGIGEKTGFIAMISALNGEILWISNDLGDRIWDIAISPDGSKVAVVYGTWSGYLAVYTLSNGALLWKSKKIEYTPYAVSWSPDGKKIAVGLGGGLVMIFSASDGSILWINKDLGSEVYDISWSPDGSKIVVGVSRYVDGEALKFDGSAVVLSSSNGEVLWVSKRLPYSEVSCVAWSPDGSKIVVGGSKYLYVFPQGDYTIINISGSSLNLKILFFNGTYTDSHILGKDGLKLYIDSGSYLIKYYLVSIPKDYRIVGNVINYFSNHPIEKSLTVEPGNIYSITPPKIEEFISKLGKLIIQGPPGTIVNITWSPSDTGSFIIPDKGVLVIYAVPRTTYNIYIKLPSSEQFIDICKVYISKEKELKQISLTKGTNIATSGMSLTNTMSSIQPEQNLRSTKSTRSTTSIQTTPNTSILLINLQSYLLIGAGLVIGAIILLIIKGRKQHPAEDLLRKLEKERESKPLPKSIKVETSSNITNSESLSFQNIISTQKTSKPSSLTISSKLDTNIIMKLLNEKIHGLIAGYSCIENLMSKKVSLVSGLVPRGFEGNWECCLLGCGGWGCAYLCKRNKENVVFKVPRGFEEIFEQGLAPTVSEKIIKKVREKAEVIKVLKHPNILRLLGVSEAAPVLVYEYADGGSVEWQLSRGWRPSIRDVVLLGIQIGDALRYIHSRGLVHGDVKPGNVFFVNGVAKIGDFSTLVKLITKTSFHSRYGYTPGFRSPEQAYSDLRLKAVELGLESRMDVYMLGNLLLYILTGESIDGEEAIEPGTVDEAVKEIQHTKLRNLIKTMLTPQPWKRPSSDEVVKELLQLYYLLENK